jgi:Ca2+/Na+ antiporter
METILDENEQSRKDERTEPSSYDEILIAKALHQNEEEAEEEEEKYGVFHFPRGEGCVTITEWMLGWPARFIFTLTVPDCRKAHLRKFYPLTFIMCIVYIALLSYVVSWMMTVIGHTLRIPDSVMGLTFIAAGTSVPEAVSSIIVAKQGLGSMSISNSIGSNTFDILMCLGLPWLIKGSMIVNDEENFIQINSGGLEYSVIILIVSLLLLYVLLASNGFYLDKKVATISAGLYALFLVFATLLELNVFFVLNQPTCSIEL